MDSLKLQRQKDSEKKEISAEQHNKFPQVFFFHISYTETNK